MKIPKLFKIVFFDSSRRTSIFRYIVWANSLEQANERTKTFIEKYFTDTSKGNYWFNDAYLDPYRAIEILGIVEIHSIGYFKAMWKYTCINKLIK
jgi:hypothetical protein